MCRCVISRLGALGGDYCSPNEVCPKMTRNAFKWFDRSVDRPTRTMSGRNVASERYTIRVQCRTIVHFEGPAFSFSRDSVKYSTFLLATSSFNQGEFPVAKVLTVTVLHNVLADIDYSSGYTLYLRFSSSCDASRSSGFPCSNRACFFFVSFSGVCSTTNVYMELTVRLSSSEIVGSCSP